MSGDLAIENLTDIAPQHRAERESNVRNFGRFGAAVAGLALALSPNASVDADAHAESALFQQASVAEASAIGVGAAAINCLRDQVVVIAHRGTGVGTRTINGIKYTEDTIRAFKYAMHAGADGYETDWLYSLSGNFWSNHDDDMQRTSNGVGKFINRTDRYIRSKKTDSGAPISTLPEVESAMAPFVGFHQEELKPALVAGMTVEQKKVQLTKVVNVIQKYMGASFHEKALFTASEISTLRIVNSIDPEAKTGFIKRGDGQADLSKLPAFIDAVMMEHSSITQNYVSKAAAQGKFVSGRSVTTVDRRNKLAEWGVPWIVTDYPARLSKGC